MLINWDQIVGLLHIVFAIPLDKVPVVALLVQLLGDEQRPEVVGGGTGDYARLGQEGGVVLLRVEVLGLAPEVVGENLTGFVILVQVVQAHQAVSFRGHHPELLVNEAGISETGLNFVEHCLPDEALAALLIQLGLLSAREQDIVVRDPDFEEDGAEVQFKHVHHYSANKI